MIKTWNERCQEHPAHATGMITHDMIQMRMQEEIHDLRAALAQPEQLVVGGDDLPTLTKWTPQRKPLTEKALMTLLPGAVRLPPGWKDFARAIEKAHGIGND
jgi:hypothetical protein